MRRSRLRKYIHSFTDFIKIAMMVFMMTMGFFLTYVLICFSFGIVLYDWMLWILLILAVVSEYVYFRWIEK